MDDQDDDGKPKLRPEVQLPPGKMDVRQHHKAMHQTDGRLVALERLPGKGWTGGVCAGIAYRLGCRPYVVRMVFVLSTLTFGLGAAAYLPLRLFLPAPKKPPKDFEARIGKKPPDDSE